MNKQEPELEEGWFIRGIDKKTVMKKKNFNLFTFVLFSVAHYVFLIYKNGLKLQSLVYTGGPLFMRFFEILETTV